MDNDDKALASCRGFTPSSDSSCGDLWEEAGEGVVGIGDNGELEKNLVAPRAVWNSISGSSSLETGSSLRKVCESTTREGP